MAKIKSIAQQIAELEEEAPQEFDPEENVQDDDSEGSEDESEDEKRETEHYIDVGKSKLRKPEEVALGPKYAGSKVSRNALEEDSNESEEEDDEDGTEAFADPDTFDLEADQEDGDIDSDEALGESDDEKFKDFVFRGSGKPRVSSSTKATKRKTAADFMSASSNEDEDAEDSEEFENSEEESVEDTSRVEDMEGLDSEEDEMSGFGGDEDNEEDGEDSDNDDVDDDDDDDDDNIEKITRSSSKLDLKAVMQQDQKRVVGTISEALKTDTEKGNAVKKQRKTFDSLLNLRIRLQKALVATNTITAVDDKDEDNTQPYQAAEEAAMKLFNTLSAMRHQLDKASGIKTGSKRKREVDVNSTSADIWQRLQAQEAASSASRKVTLEKWSEKVKSTTASTTPRGLNSAAAQTLTQVLADQLSSPSHLIKRTRTPRSCAPLQVSRKLTEDASIYDDADFYQLLLKELVDQRMVDSASAPAQNGASGKPLAQWTAVKEAKTRKNVDTKASKGRKMKFTVHEKLQNFMAPQDRGSWERDAIDRFFGALLGQRVDLGEEPLGDSDDEGGAPLAEEALMLFRS